MPSPSPQHIPSQVLQRGFITSLCHQEKGKIAIKINQRLAAPFVIWRRAVPAWMGRELRQETINKAVGL